MTDYVSALTNAFNPYHSEAVKLAVSLRNEATISDGVIRWNSNNRVPPADCVKLAASIGLSVDVAACDAGRDADLKAFLELVRAARAERTEEQIAEERREQLAAFGPGVRLVNVLTGETNVTGFTVRDIGLIPASELSALQAMIGEG